MLKKWWSFDYFFFLASEALKIFWGPQKRPNFWILDLWVCLKKLGLEPGWYGKSVLYLLTQGPEATTTFSVRWAWDDFKGSIFLCLWFHLIFAMHAYCDRKSLNPVCTRKYFRLYGLRRRGHLQAAQFKTLLGLSNPLLWIYS